jgi:serine/threonine protein kinase/tetratricopeptide (TPR) repeat protein
MTPEEWSRIKEVLEVVLELEPSARERYLDDACASREVNRVEIEALVRSYEGVGNFLEEPVDVASMELVQETVLRPWAGRRLGPYQIIQKIGEGGMGTVFRATRVDGLYDREVAIKVIRHGLDTKFFIARFKNESRILAGLEHPNVARLLDGGVTEEGLPYVVLEHVVGLPIDEYCDQHNLPTDERLKLFRTVCSAVQYAHQNLVVHRDLKPGNILVTPDGVPKLLDFGIAKILDPQHEESGADQTLTILRMMTPDFASPEQVRGDTITTASDVYSLGVILYLLLTGKRPYRLKSSSPQEMIKAVCETEPEKPSTAALRSGDDPPHTERPTSESGVSGAHGALTRARLRRSLSKDLDHIVLKALRKEPTRRYVTVAQFSEDIKRYLEHLPVSARKDTLGYRTSKFVTRHKAGVVAAVTVAAILVVGMLITLREARIAERRFNEVRSLSNSLIFDIHDSIKDLPGSTPARKLIADRALHYLNSLALESRGDLSLQRELATAYERVGLVQGQYLQNSLGDTQGSLASYQTALDIRQQIAAKSSDWKDRLALAQAYRLVANQQWATGDYPHAVENISSAVLNSEALNSARPNDWEIIHELGFDYEVAGDVLSPQYAGGPSDRAKATEYYRKALSTDEEMLRLKPEDLHSLDGYAIDLSHFGDSVEATDKTAALAYFKKELEIEQKLHQRSTEIRYARGVAIACNKIATEYERMGDHQRALENHMHGLEIYKDLIRVDPKNVNVQRGLAIAYINTAIELVKTGGTAQSLEFTKNSLEIMRGVVASSPENRLQRGTLATITVTGASIFLRLDKPNDALKEFERADAIYESLHSAEPATGPSLKAAACREKMGEAAVRLGNSNLAAAYFHQALAAVEPLLSAREPDIAVLYTAADAYSGLGDLERREARRADQDGIPQRNLWLQARSWYVKSLDTWHRIQSPSRDGPNGFDAGDPTQVAKSLHLCETALAKPGAGPGA